MLFIRSKNQKSQLVRIPDTQVLPPRVVLIRKQLSLERLGDFALDPIQLAVEPLAIVRALRAHLGRPGRDHAGYTAKLFRNGLKHLFVQRRQRHCVLPDVFLRRLQLALHLRQSPVTHHARADGLEEFLRVETRLRVKHARLLADGAGELCGTLLFYFFHDLLFLRLRSLSHMHF